MNELEELTMACLKLFGADSPDELDRMTTALGTCGPLISDSQDSHRVIEMLRMITKNHPEFWR